MKEEWALAKEKQKATLTEAEDQNEKEELNRLDTQAAVSSEEEAAAAALAQELEEGDAVTASSTSGAADFAGGAEEGLNETRQSKLQALLTEKLPESINKAKADEFTVAFCFLNSKGARKKLVTAVSRLPRSRGELAPTYARIIASIGRVFPDFSAPIVDSLWKEFFGMIRSKHQFNIEKKMLNVRYLGELVKFNVAPPIVALKMFKFLLNDFSQHNVELLALLLETCGRYLYLLPHTTDKMMGVLNTMLRFRRAKNLDLRQQTLLETAYFVVKPPERVAKAKKTLSVVQQYTRHLIQIKLDEPNFGVEPAIKALRRLPWHNAEEAVEYHLVKAVLKISRTKYTSLPNVADCISGLSRYYPNVLVRLVDCVLEELQRGLDSPYKREIQRNLGLIKLIGELYNYTAVSSTLIFDLLYHIINFGHAVVDGTGETGSASVTASGRAKVKFDPRVPSEIDPPTDLFRSQLVCELLNTCGQYYVRGQAKERLNRFLMYFQRYLLTKQYVPLHIEFSILDTLDTLEEQARDVIIQSQKKSAGPSKGKRAAAAAAQAVVFEKAIFTRYSSLEEVQGVIDAFEAAHAGEEQEEGDEEQREEEPEEAEDEEQQEEGDGEEGSDDDHDEEQEDEDEEQQQQEEVSEREAARMLEKLRLAEEDEEFEKAFRSVMQQSVVSASVVGGGGGTVRANDVNRMVIPG